MSKITLGSDPELFLVSRGTKKFVSAVGKCKGTKEEPFEFDKGFKIHNDNVAIEFNIPPARSVEQWVEYHHKALQYCRNLAIENDCNLKVVADAEFPESELQTPEAKEFGCNPDFNAWTLESNPSPRASNTRLRTAGGHIHIGCELTFREKVQVVRLLDIFLGIPLKMKEPKSRRNELYGNPGSMRDKEYGVEYRTLSNYWLRSTGVMMDVYKSVFNIVSQRESLFPVLEQVEGDILKMGQKDFAGLLNRTLSGHTNLYVKEFHEYVLQGA